MLWSWIAHFFKGLLVIPNSPALSGTATPFLAGPWSWGAGGRFSTGKIFSQTLHLKWAFCPCLWEKKKKRQQQSKILLVWQIPSKEMWLQCFEYLSRFLTSFRFCPVNSWLSCWLLRKKIFTFYPAFLVVFSVGIINHIEEKRSLFLFSHEVWFSLELISFSPLTFYVLIINISLSSPLVIQISSQ